MLRRNGHLFLQLSSRIITRDIDKAFQLELSDSYLAFDLQPTAESLLEAKN